ncbi:MAG: AAA family ATPase [Chloroflexi bacterium]|nr:AAA family ATPase [Chloroflexota bacterium]
MSTAHGENGGAADGAPLGIVTSVDRIWLLGPFHRVLDKRAREKTLLDQLDECLSHLWRNPGNVGLNVEQIRVAGRYPVLSARISRQFRLIFVQFTSRELGLLHFDNHDEAYRWVDQHVEIIPTMLERVEQIHRGESVTHLRPTPFPRVAADDPILLQAQEEFRRMLEDGIERYLGYLTNEQRWLVETQARGLLLIKGGAGTGKTAVAVHRVAHLARQVQLIDPRPVLYLCYNRVLAHAAQSLLTHLYGSPMLDNVEVRTVHHWCDLYLAEPAVSNHLDEPACQQLFYRCRSSLLIAAPDALAPLKEMHPDHVFDEITHVLKGCALASADEYVAFNRRGRGFSLREVERRAIWALFKRFERWQRDHHAYQFADLPLLALRKLATDSSFRPYRAVVLDEAQDCSPAMLRLARQLAGGPDGQLTVLADPAQDIYESGFIWAQRELRPHGGDTRWLDRNFRNTREIYELARPLVEGIEGIQEDLTRLKPPERTGPRPTLLVFQTPLEEIAEVCRRVAAEVQQRPPQHVAVLASYRAWLAECSRCLIQERVPHRVIVDTKQANLAEPTVKLVTIHSAKGLDFPVVYLASLTRRGFFGPARGDSPAARRLLYVAMTRASEHLVLSTVLDDEHPLVKQLVPDHCDVDGPCAAVFSNLYGESAR